MGFNVNKNQKGLTLTELLVVAATLIILMTLAISRYPVQVNKGFDAKRMGDLYHVKVALDEFEKDNNCYPTSLPVCTPGDGLAPYMNKIPCDPRTNENYHYFADNLTSCPRWFWLFTKLDWEEHPKISELGCQNGCGEDASNLIYNYYISSDNAPEPTKGH